MDAIDLTDRTGLPDALRVLSETYPRAMWPEHDNFHGLVRFWMDRHLMFRKLLGLLQDDAEARIDGKMAAEVYLPRLQRFGSMFLEQLHGHHQIEDMHYFPKLVDLDGRLARGFRMLDADHQVLDGLLNRMEEGANAVLTGGEAGVFHGEVQRFEGFLNRHLEDEEELIVPIILTYGPPAMD